ncbi:hypothetical protein P1J78_16745 [Psychromarinibacter sp. C21-152]|uniref:Uncharacterized protein n=1 Tax=Psychromarinibacter sediminicola TaxID=3033385 RepID=A0AAE3NTY0_9RHOB|nr:hypothetical protein [Psychromarinibacter sediminicola]MDF0602389.1 hypothetical protein [Psychromarinibacter sediminicola]
MKRLLMTTALVLTTAAGTASAQMADGDNVQLRNEVGNYLAASEWTVDVDSLTTEQLVEIHSAITSDESATEVDSAVEAVLNDGNVEYTERPAYVVVETEELPRDQIFTKVSNALIGTEYEGMAWTLSDEELVQAYSVVNSTDDQSDMYLELSGLFE